TATAAAACVAGAVRAGAGSPARAAPLAASSGRRSSDGSRTPGRPHSPTCAPRGQTHAADSRTTRHPPTCGSLLSLRLASKARVSREPDGALIGAVHTYQLKSKGRVSPPLGDSPH